MIALDKIGVQPQKNSYTAVNDSGIMKRQETFAKLNKLKKSGITEVEYNEYCDIINKGKLQ